MQILSCLLAFQIIALEEFAFGMMNIFFSLFIELSIFVQKHMGKVGIQARLRIHN